MTRSEFLRLVEELLEVPPGALTGGEALAELGQWDSTAMLGFIALADEHCGVILPPRQLAACATVSDLLALVGDRLTG